MKRYFLIFSFFMIAPNIHAQQESPVIKFSNITSTGLLSGQSQNVLTLQTINGIKYKTWFAGIGAAYDTYGYTSIPLFIDIRKTIGNKKWQPFIYADAGVNFSLYSDILPRKINGVDAYKFYDPFYGETGLGLGRTIYGKTTFTLSAGFSYKEFSYLQYSYPSSPPGGAQIAFYYRRFSIKMGVQF